MDATAPTAPTAPDGPPRQEGTPGVARGRRPSTSRRDVARVALELFARQGFDATTVDEIAAAVGVSRRTFFRYYESKRDVVWGEFDAELQRLRGELASAPADRPMMDVLRRAVIAANRFGDVELDELRIRILLISTVPTLIAHSAVRYAEWCDVVAEFVADRTGRSRHDLGPQTAARAALGAATAAFTFWAGREGGDLVAAVDRAFRLLAAGFDEGGPTPSGGPGVARRGRPDGAMLDGEPLGATGAATRGGPT